MYSKIAAAALVVGSAYAAPMMAEGATAADTSAFPTMASSDIASQMASSTGGAAFPTGTGSGSTGSSVFSYPLPNGFPDIKNPSPQLDRINQKAGGQLSNNGPPSDLQPDSVNSLAFVAFNELMEVAFFTELLHNVSSGAPGFTEDHLLGLKKHVVVDNLRAIRAQEELHELNANGAFANNANGQKVLPCTYDFSKAAFDFESAINTASTFTDVVLGTLPDIQTVAATAGDIGLIRGVGASLGQEGEQNGFYRSILGKVPSQLPFLTGSARNFAYNAILQNFVVECPKETTDILENPAGGIPLNVTGKLSVESKMLDITEDVYAEFSVQTVVVSNTRSYYESSKDKMRYVTYINQQNKPLSVPIKDIQFGDNTITFKASFPGKSAFLNGFTIAAVTATNDLKDVQAVASATLFGPGLIEIN